MCLCGMKEFRKLGIVWWYFNGKERFLYTVILTTTVFAALITSIANIIISLINSYRLKHIEEQKS